MHVRTRMEAFHEPASEEASSPRPSPPEEGREKFRAPFGFKVGKQVQKARAAAVACPAIRIPWVNGWILPPGKMPGSTTGRRPAATQGKQSSYG